MRHSPPDGYQPGLVTVYVRSERDGDVTRGWELSIWPVGSELTVGTYPVVASGDLGPGTASWRLDDYLCSDADESTRLEVHEIEYDEFGPARIRVEFSADCPTGGSGQYYATTEGEISIRAQTG